MRTVSWSHDLREKTNTLDPDCLRYLNQTFGVEDEALLKIRNHAQEQSREGMQVSPYEGQILQSLVRWSGSRSVLELGTLFGYSSLWMARGLGEEGRLLTVEKSEERHQFAKQAIGATEVSEKVTFLCGDIEELKGQVEQEGPFDFVFIDANKSGYLKQLLWLEPLVKCGGFIVGDNTFMFGGVFGAEVEPKWSKSVVENMKKFNERLADRQLYQASLIPTPEGLTVAQKLF
jgi:predicted O-methyltransferase YrrM